MVFNNFVYNLKLGRTVFALLCMYSSSVLYSDDALSIVDSVVVEDSVILHKINHKCNSLFIATDTILYNSILQQNYTTLTDILNEQMFYFVPLHTGIPGNSNAFAVFGALPTENGLLLNGVYASYMYGSSNFDALSPESVSGIELLSGSRSVIVAGKSGSVVNMQTVRYDTKKPYTRIWYTQGDNKLMGVDATYSQNFLPNWNVTAGFRRLSSNSYYTNSFVDSWNTRVELRHNVSDLSAISLLYHFTNYEQGDFGGILFSDYNTNNNAPTQTRSNFSYMKDRQYKTDVMLSYYDGTADTLLSINANLFFNHNENNILFSAQKELLAIDSTGKNMTNAINYGVNAYMQYTLPKHINLVVGGAIGYNNIPSTIVNEKYSGANAYVFANLTTDLANTSLDVGARIASKYGKSLIGAGLNMTHRFDTTLSLSADISMCNTEPIPILNYLNERHYLGIITADKSDDNWKLEVNGFYRIVENPIELQLDKSNIYNSTIIIGSNKSMYGAVGKIDINIIKNTICIVKFNTYFENKEPKCLLSATAKYIYVKGINFVSGGIRFNALLDGQKYYYNPIYKYYSQTETDDVFEFDGVGVFLSAKFGNAFVRASLNNLLGTSFSYLAYYPIQKQEFSLSLTWAFPDGR